MGPYLFVESASVSAFCHFLLPSENLFLKQLILLTRTQLTQMDLSPSPRKASDGKCFSLSLLGSDELCRIKLTSFLSSPQILSAQTFQLCSLF
jgi:hypothetical protein